MDDTKQVDQIETKQDLEKRVAKLEEQMQRVWPFFPKGEPAPGPDSFGNV